MHIHKFTCVIGKSLRSTICRSNEGIIRSSTISLSDMHKRFMNLQSWKIGCVNYVCIFLQIWSQICHVYEKDMRFVGIIVLLFLYQSCKFQIQASGNYAPNFTHYSMPNFPHYAHYHSLYAPHYFYYSIVLMIHCCFVMIQCTSVIMLNYKLCIIILHKLCCINYIIIIKF